MAGRVAPLLRNGFALAVTNFVLISSLVFLAGESRFPFLPLYLLAALGTVIWIRGAAKTAVAAVVAVGGYLAATIAAAYPASPSWYAVGLNVVFIGFSCVLAWMIGDGVRRLEDRVADESVALADARRRTERAESLASRVGPVLGLSTLDGILRWTLETARAVAGSTYAHVAGLDGTHHRTLAEGDADACPSWWHPTIQRLVLWSCREDRVLRSEEVVHGIEGFVAVPIGPEGGERWGAIVLGGKAFDDAEVRALKLLADAVAPALEGAGEAPAGRDPVTGLPNRSSLHRVLDRRLSQSRTLTVLVAGLDGFRSYNKARGPDAGDELLRRVGRRLGESHRHVFRLGDEEFVVIQNGVGASRARETALALRRLVSQEAAYSGGIGERLVGVSVGFVVVDPGEGETDLVVDDASRFLAEARGRPDGVAGSALGDFRPDSGGAERGTAEAAAGIVLALAEAAELRGPHIGRHSKAVARIARRVGSRLSLSPEQMRALELGALLHDLGKIGVPDYVLSKSDRLTEEEHEVLRSHPALGVRMLARIAELAPAAPVVRHHHERFDGRGYPDGLAGEDIPLVARVVSVADAFDALVRDRPGVRGVPEKDALEEIERGSGTQFDPEVVRAFLETIETPDDRRAGSA
jgi:diguanylate cyclase (GGDEF)-like protein/putative nucleotidyltransferase with HDIG domain